MADQQQQDQPSAQALVDSYSGSPGFAGINLALNPQKPTSSKDLQPLAEKAKADMATGEQGLDTVNKQIMGLQLHNNKDSIPQPFKREKAPEYQEPDPSEMLGSTGLIFAALASFGARAHMTTALNAGAEAMKAFKKGKMDEFEAHYRAWKDSSEEAFRMHQEEWTRYQAIVNDDKMHYDEMYGKLTALGAQYQNRIMTGRWELEQVQKVMDARQRAYENARDYSLRMDQFVWNKKKDIAELQKDPNYAALVAYAERNKIDWDPMKNPAPPPGLKEKAFRDPTFHQDIRDAYKDKQYFVQEEQTERLSMKLSNSVFLKQMGIDASWKLAELKDSEFRAKLEQTKEYQDRVLDLRERGLDQNDRKLTIQEAKEQAYEEFNRARISLGERHEENRHEEAGKRIDAEFEKIKDSKEFHEGTLAYRGHELDLKRDIERDRNNEFFKNLALKEHLGILTLQEKAREADQRSQDSRLSTAERAQAHDDSIKYHQERDQREFDLRAKALQEREWADQHRAQQADVNEKDKVAYLQRAADTRDQRLKLETEFKNKKLDEQILEFAARENDRTLDRTSRDAATTRRLDLVEEKARNEMQVKTAQLEERAREAKARSEDTRYGIDTRKMAMQEAAEARKGIAESKLQYQYATLNERIRVDENRQADFTLTLDERHKAAQNVLDYRRQKDEAEMQYKYTALQQRSEDKRYEVDARREATQKAEKIKGIQAHYREAATQHSLANEQMHQIEKTHLGSPPSPHDRDYGSYVKLKDRRDAAAKLMEDSRNATTQIYGTDPETGKGAPAGVGDVPRPDNIDQDTWDHMTPDEKKLFAKK